MAKEKDPKEGIVKKIEDAVYTIETGYVKEGCQQLRWLISDLKGEHQSLNYLP